MNLFPMASLVPVIAAVVEGKKAGGLGILKGSAVGVITGFVCFWGLGVLLIWWPRKLGFHEENPASKIQRFKMFFAYTSLLIAVAWVVALSFSGYWITKLIVHL